MERRAFEQFLAQAASLTRHQRLRFAHLLNDAVRPDQLARDAAEIGAGRVPDFAVT
jgi:hypothetical protein